MSKKHSEIQDVYHKLIKNETGHQIVYDTYQNNVERAITFFSSIVKGDSKKSYQYILNRKQTYMTQEHIEQWRNRRMKFKVKVWSYQASSDISF